MIKIEWWILAGSLSLNVMYMIRGLQDNKDFTWGHMWRGFLLGMIAGPLALPVFLVIQKWIDSHNRREKQRLEVESRLRKRKRQPSKRQPSKRQPSKRQHRSNADYCPMCDSFDCNCHGC